MELKTMNSVMATLTATPTSWATTPVPMPMNAATTAITPQNNRLRPSSQRRPNTYIQRAPGQDDDERYQTVFARELGAVAAPTAGLHFDDALLATLRDRGVEFGHVTLHVGAGTFQPMRVDNIHEHTMHSEWLNVGAALVEQVRATRARGGRVVAVGTTVVRALESAMRDGELQPFAGETRIFIFPGYRIRSVDALLTNFHLPESTLLMLVSAFAGREFMLEAYRHAVAQRYRFFSYGDAMLIWPGSGDS